MKGKKQLDKLDNCTPIQAWKEIVGGKEEMDEQSFSQFFTQTLKLPEESILQFYLLTTGMKCPKLGHITFQNFEYLFKFSGQCKNIKQLKKLLPKMEKDLNDPKVFKQMYRNIFEIFLIKTQSMEFQFAQSLWSVLLVRDFVFLKQFKMYLDYLGNKKPTKCHKDLWNMIHEFATTVKNVSNDYKESDAWPVFLDNFIDFMKQQKMV